MFRIANNLLPQYFVDMFKLNCAVHGYNTRQISDYHIPYHRLVVTSDSMRINGVKIWNCLSNDIKTAKTLSLFRTRYKKYLINN
jgi:hypothetical protein